MSQLDLKVNTVVNVALPQFRKKKLCYLKDNNSFSSL